ncbi:MAG: hypothetical protein ACFFCZ_04685 [Promethearchaeota archaeon]
MAYTDNEIQQMFGTTRAEPKQFKLIASKRLTSTGITIPTNMPIVIFLMTMIVLVVRRVRKRKLSRTN